MCSFSDSEGPRFALLRFTPIDRRGSKDRKIAAFFRKGEVRSHHRGITDNRAVRALDRGQGRGWGEDATLLTVLFQSFARFSTPTGGQPLDSAGETRGGHRDKTSGNWRNSAVILPVMFYPPHTYTLSRPFVGARRPPSPPSLFAFVYVHDSTTRPSSPFVSQRARPLCGFLYTREGGYARPSTWTTS